MAQLLCPLCGQPLLKQENRLVCSGRHSFDIARQGYVNLLPVHQKHSLHPGDTKEQVAARRAFLDTGVYSPIASAVCQAAVTHCPQARDILDVGCGEGYYGSLLLGALPEAELWGLDISKDAVRLAAGRHKNAHWLCGTAAKLPFDQDFDLLVSMFALTLPEEFARVLKPGGIFLQVLAAEDHLMGLKNVIYPEILLREKNTVPQLPGFCLVESRSLSFPFRVEGEQIGNLLSMTPHFWRISKEGAARLSATAVLEDRASVVVNVFRRLSGE